MPAKLTDIQIKQKLTEGRNYKRLYLELKDKFDTVTSDLKSENKELRQLLQQVLDQNKTQAIRIAELESMVFGKKKRPPMGGTPITTSVPSLFAPEPKKRGADSYRRPVPPAHTITEEVAVPLLEVCSHCGATDSFDQEKITTHDRFREDIPLPDLTPDYQALLVTKCIVQRGICLTSDCS